MRSLAEAFHDPASRVYRALMFIDMANSIDMKMRTPEAAWLTTYGWFFDTIDTIIKAKHGSVVKHLDQRVMAAFTEDHITDAINAAIEIQEAAAVANANNQVYCQCTVGVASGQVVEFQTPQENIDYIGTVVDKAARLCVAASPKAVFVDTDTIAAAQLSKVVSRLGAASFPGRRFEQYVGSKQKLLPEGFSSPIEYHEILWGQHHYGLKSAVSTLAIEGKAYVATEVPNTPIAGKPNTQKRFEDNQTRQPQILRIVIASPGDVEAERDSLNEVAAELNRGMAAVCDLRIEISQSETDAFPGFHPEGPQGLIDPILRVEDCDLLIGIFWKHFGTSTPNGRTGTEHEFHIAYEAWQRNGRPQIMVYFNQKPYTPRSEAEAEQWRQVLEFKENFPKEGLCWHYEGKVQFKNLVRDHLSRFIRELNTERLSKDWVL